MVHAAEDDHIIEPGVFSEIFRILLDLDRQFACGRQHQHPAGTGLAGVIRQGFTQEPGHGGSEEGRGLAGTGLRLGCKVVPRDGVGQTFCLDLGAILEAQILSCRHDLFFQIQIAETQFALFLRHRLKFRQRGDHFFGNGPLPAGFWLFGGNFFPAGTAVGVPDKGFTIGIGLGFAFVPFFIGGLGFFLCRFLPGNRLFRSRLERIFYAIEKGVDPAFKFLEHVCFDPVYILIFMKSIIYYA